MGKILLRVGQYLELGTGFSASVLYLKAVSPRIQVNGYVEGRYEGSTYIGEVTAGGSPLVVTLTPCKQKGMQDCVEVDLSRAVSVHIYNTDPRPRQQQVVRHGVEAYAPTPKPRIRKVAQKKARSA